jgi:predicted SnoaL-like aldol condensation-catalyzing enzyme
MGDTLLSDSAEQNRQAVLRLIEGWNEASVDWVDELIAPEYTIHHDAGSQWDGKVLSRREYKDRLLSYRGVHFDVVDTIAEGAKVALSVKMSAPAATGPDGEALRPAIETTGIVIYDFRDGLIAGHWQVIAR